MSIYRFEQSSEYYVILFKDNKSLFKIYNTFPYHYFSLNNGPYKYFTDYRLLEIYSSFISINFQGINNSFDSVQSMLARLNNNNRGIVYSESINDTIQFTLTQPLFFDSDSGGSFSFPLGSRIDYLLDSAFDTNLYPELINNHETKSMLETWVNDGDISGWTSDDKQIMQMIEDYNHNVLQLRATKKVDASVFGSISSSSGSQQVDLSFLNANTARIANNLQMLDDNQNVKSITKVLDDKNNDQQVVVTTVEKAPYNPLLEDDEF